MRDIPLWEGEELLLRAGVEFAGVDRSPKGQMIITDRRVAVSIMAETVSMYHDRITSFKWEEGFRKGSNFMVTWYNDRDESVQSYYRSGAKKKIAGILEGRPYYGRPALLKITKADEDESSPGIAMHILRIRYASGLVTRDEFLRAKSEIL